MNEEVEKLWELQTVMSQLADREKQLTVKPESFAAVDREWQSASAEKTKLTESLEQLGRERRRVEGELSDQQEILRKYQGQLMQVKNQQQYAAAWKEIDATRKHVKDLEDSLLKNMTDIEAVQSQLDERAAAHDDLKSRYDTAHDTWQHSLSDLRAEVDDLRKRAEAIEHGIREPLRREFHRIFKQRHGVAVAPVVNESCGACRTRIRPALSQQLKRGELVHCEGCHRILHLDRTQP